MKDTEIFQLNGPGLWLLMWQAFTSVIDETVNMAGEPNISCALPMQTTELGKGFEWYMLDEHSSAAT